jgi:hypothetical protein
MGIEQAYNARKASSIHDTKISSHVFALSTLVKVGIRPIGLYGSFS